MGRIPRTATAFLGRRHSVPRHGIRHGTAPCRTGGLCPCRRPREGPAVPILRLNLGGARTAHRRAAAPWHRADAERPAGRRGLRGQAARAAHLALFSAPGARARQRAGRRLRVRGGHGGNMPVRDAQLELRRAAGEAPDRLGNAAGVQPVGRPARQGGRGVAPKCARSVAESERAAAAPVLPRGEWRRARVRGAAHLSAPRFGPAPLSHLSLTRGGACEHRRYALPPPSLVCRPRVGVWGLGFRA